MLGKTAGGLFWMSRYLERSENSARLIDAGFRIALTRSKSAADEWESVLTTVGARTAYCEKYDDFSSTQVIDFLLRDTSNPGSVLSITKLARDNARLVRTAITREVWEATNESWMTLKDLFRRKVREQDLPDVLNTIRQQSALVRGAVMGTMIRNDGFNFSRLGTFIERADNTARILDVKYYLLLPTIANVGSSLDNVQWETILRSVSAQRSYRWLNGPDTNPVQVAEYLIINRQMPRALAFCYNKIDDNLGHLEGNYGERTTASQMADDICEEYMSQPIETIFDNGLHEYLLEFLAANNRLAMQIEQDYRFQQS
ncbi:alpha-E domain-containing protein [Alterisphingorhabdus coralli]|uniref:Alpha-E domain-containing protein n=1 Tax=Alterisphingorhabdus coralli TaxID=3071408 RepID=A0AA97FC73_9SPHN|nr:alpha-E domain-containing protein [Parasphingorhabdus sp. SCSIO 66989]WOE76375.1 alpha-E domain-containing protein [Parasphingorhabdus sp. SCSIO 66989]